MFWKKKVPDVLFLYTCKEVSIFKLLSEVSPSTICVLCGGIGVKRGQLVTVICALECSCPADHSGTMQKPMNENKAGLTPNCDIETKRIKQDDYI